LNPQSLVAESFSQLLITPHLENSEFLEKRLVFDVFTMRVGVIRARDFLIGANSFPPEKSAHDPGGTSRKGTGHISWSFCDVLPPVVVSWGCSCAAPGADTSSKTAKDLRLLNPARPSF
jgi:hypothetical protein